MYLSSQSDLPKHRVSKRPLKHLLLGKDLSCTSPLKVTFQKHRVSKRPLKHLSLAKGPFVHLSLQNYWLQQRGLFLHLMSSACSCWTNRPTRTSPSPRPLQNTAPACIRKSRIAQAKCNNIIVSQKNASYTSSTHAIMHFVGPHLNIGALAQHE